MWTGFVQDEKRIRHRIIEKACEQLPKKELNFVYIPNYGEFDDIDFQEAFLGKEVWLIKKKKLVFAGREKNGSVSIIKDKNYSPICGLIYSDWDYTKKKLIRNPLIHYPKSYERLID